MASRSFDAAIVPTLAIFFLATRVQSYPTYFIQLYSTSCNDHPRQAYAEHGPPIADPLTSISFINQGSNALSSKFCPGATYLVNVSWPATQSRMILASSNAGNLTSTTSSLVDTTCPNRYYTPGIAPIAKGVLLTLTLPCAVPAGSVTIRVTSSLGQVNQYLTASAALPFDPSCGVGACSPPPSPSPPPTLTSICSSIQWNASRLPSICSSSPQLAASPACTLHSQCMLNGTSRPSSRVCNATRIFSSLCLDVPGLIPECLQASQLFSGNTSNFRSCLLSSAFSIYSSATTVGWVLAMCDDMGGQMAGCSSCTGSSAASCPQPLISLGQGCLDMWMGQCNGWTDFCQTDGLGGNGIVGNGAPLICLSAIDIANLRSPPPSSPPPPPTNFPPPPSPSPPNPPLSLQPPPSPPSPPPPFPLLSPSSALSCVQDPTQPSCVSYIYPTSSVITDLSSLCNSMPGMPTCTIWATCYPSGYPTSASTSTSSSSTDIYCSPFILLANGCNDMPSMTACTAFKSLCKQGSKVNQCLSQQGIPSAAGFQASIGAISSMCSDHGMSGCADCTPPYSPQSCPNPLATLSNLCFGMEGMAGCSGLYNMCAASSSFANSSSPSLSVYCPGYYTNSNMGGSSSPSSSFAIPSVSYAPTMLMYFHQRYNEYILWKTWEPMTSAQYAGSCIAVIFFGIASVALRTLQSCTRLYFLSLESEEGLIEPSLNGHPDDKVSQANSALHLASIAIKTSNSSDSGAEDNHGEGDAVTGAFWFLCSWRIFSQNFLLAFILGLALTLDYFNMLVVMTYNIGLFVAVVMGYVLGSLVFMHVSDRYTKRLYALKVRRRKEATGV